MPPVRFMVRGRWRHQPHGSGAAQRWLIWSRPHQQAVPGEMTCDGSWQQNAKALKRPVSGFQVEHRA